MFGTFLLLPAVVTFLYYEDYTSLLMMTLIILSFVFFYIGAGLFYKVSSVRELKYTVGNRRFVWFLLYMFVLTYLLMFIDFGGIPLLQYSNVENTSILRAEFTKADGGLLSVLTYFKSIFSKGMLPILVCWFYFKESRKAFICMVVVLTFLMLSAFEKAGLLWIFLPLFFIQFHEKKYKEFFQSILFVLICTSFVSVVSLSHLASATNDKSNNDITNDITIKYANIKTYRNPDDFLDDAYIITKDNHLQSSVSSGFSLASVYEEDDYQFLLTFGMKTDPLLFMLNRLFWIPFITAYDTLLFWQQNYNEHLYFGVNRYLAAMTGYPFADLERRVFRFQFGSGIGSTGNSNASYISEAYIGFGYIGVAVFSFLLGGMTGVFSKSDITVFRVVLPLVYFSVLSASFISSLFSGGLLLMFVIFFILTRSVNERSS